MAEESFQERSEKATPRRRQEAREKGDVPKSTEVNAAVVLLIGLLSLRVFGGTMLNRLTGLMKSVFGQLSVMEITLENVPIMVLSGVKFMGLLLAPLVLLIMISGVGANLLQSGFLLLGHWLLLAPFGAFWLRLSLGLGLCTWFTRFCPLLLYAHSLLPELGVRHTKSCSLSNLFCLILKHVHGGHPTISIWHQDDVATLKRRLTHVLSAVITRDNAKG